MPNAKDATGFDKVLPRSALETTFLRLLESSNKLYTIPGDLEVQKLNQLSPCFIRVWTPGR